MRLIRLSGKRHLEGCIEGKIHINKTMKLIKNTLKKNAEK
jgi:hypothetical protein